MTSNSMKVVTRTHFIGKSKDNAGVRVQLEGPRRLSTNGASGTAV
eukprot:CAMPEP_0115083752 /NCGR_PEP_ID=MMETSP0227-20121206/20780_1 /TAXON_ID=89957 /ORGANISM="Polarella glacialis, Strain CCMP 1383" /LENGTH=44 /DNA_ID= /DNA_START= /DNA_END= /DNA_ORIENTATION=